MYLRNLLNYPVNIQMMMENILDRIVADKRELVARYRSNLSHDYIPKAIEKRIEFIKSYYNYFDRSCLMYENRFVSMKNAILRSENGMIAEFKRRSPSKGNICLEAVVEEVIPLYNEKNVAGISVLTDTKYFGGCNEDFSKARAMTSKPMLRKDFIVDEYQILESSYMGANTILLIAACLTKDEVKRFAALAHSLNMETLLEVHNEEEIGHYCDDIDIIGVNNRNLKTFVTDLDISLSLYDKLPDMAVKISESGIASAEDLKMLREAGYNGFLVGESMMRKLDIL